MGLIFSRSNWFAPVGFFLIFFIFGTAAAGAWEQTGIASWYGGIFHGRKTANGETYDTFALTAAHRSLPFGTVLEVTNLKNNRKVRVRVNDRGPFVDSRVIDLSYAAARELDMILDGTASVHMTALEGTMPAVRFVVQVGAWGDPKNALRHRRRLENAGIKPQAVLGSDGITRISIDDVSEQGVLDIVQILEGMGYSKLFIYQNSTKRSRK